MTPHQAKPSSLSAANPNLSTNSNANAKQHPKASLSALIVAELVGTFLLVALGDGAIAANVVTRTPVNVFVACLAFGVGAMLGLLAATPVSAGHLNPAVTLAFAIRGKLAWRELPAYFVGQYLGGFLAALTIFATYREGIVALDISNNYPNISSLTWWHSTNASGGIFATYPAPHLSLSGALIDQVIGTAILLFALSVISEARELCASAKPFAVALAVCIACVAFSGNCGAPFNPARDLAPRLATFLLGYHASFSHLSSLYWLVGGLVGPHIGAVLGVLAHSGFVYLQQSLIASESEQLAARVDVGASQLGATISTSSSPSLGIAPKTYKATAVNIVTQRQQQQPRSNQMDNIALTPNKQPSELVA